jgi:hypothetical protein
MHSGIARLVALAFVTILVGGCQADRPLAMDADQPALAALAAGGLGTPSSLTSTATSNSQINLTWADNSGNETGFELQRSTTGPAGAFTVLATTGASVRGYTDTGLSPLTQYCYRVRALRVTSGNTKYSGFSNTACATTPGPPPAPSNADAKPASSSAVDVTWADNSGAEDGVRVERSAATTGPWEAVATTAPNATLYRDSGRPGEQQVCYRVIAFNAHGDSAPSNSDCTTPPAGPSNLTAATAAQGIDLAWADNSAVEGGYEVQRATDGVTFSTLADLPANSTSYRDATATSNTTTYWYRVRAKKDGGFSDPSNVASAQGGCAPLGATEICDNGVADDDCDGLPEGTDSDCQIDCGVGCPARYVCDIGTGFCVPHCNDGAWNGDEGGPDCGGACDTKCQSGQQCTINFDCASGSCVANRCQ